MEWLAVDSVSCPVTGTTFTFIISTDNNKIILWYQGGERPHRGEIVCIAMEACGGSHLHRVRESYVQDKVKTTNQMHAFLLEFGISVPRGPTIISRLSTILEDANLPLYIS